MQQKSKSLKKQKHQQTTSLIEIENIEEIEPISTITAVETEQSTTPIIATESLPKVIEESPATMANRDRRKKVQKQPMGKLLSMVVCRCGKKFEYIWNLTYHKKWECGQDLKCSYCNDTFADISFLILRRHRDSCPKR